MTSSLLRFASKRSLLDISNAEVNGDSQGGAGGGGDFRPVADLARKEKGAFQTSPTCT